MSVQRSNTRYIRYERRKLTPRENLRALILRSRIRELCDSSRTLFASRYPPRASASCILSLPRAYHEAVRWGGGVLCAGMQIEAAKQSDTRGGGGSGVDLRRAGRASIALRSRSRGGEPGFSLRKLLLPRIGGRKKSFLPRRNARRETRSVTTVHKV